MNRDRAEVEGSLADAEEAREKKEHDERILAALQGLGKATKDSGKKGKGGLFGSLTSGITGMAMNMLAFSKVIKPALGSVVGFKKLRAGFTGLMKATRKTFPAVKGALRGIGTFFKKGGTFRGAMSRTFGKGGHVAKGMARIGKYFKKGGAFRAMFSGLFSKTGKMAGAMNRVKSLFGAGTGKLRPRNAKGQFIKQPKGFARITYAMGQVKKWFGGKGPLGRGLKAIGGAFKEGGKFSKLLLPLKGLMRIFGWPLTIIMGIIGGIKGFMSAYGENGSILEGIGGGLVGIVDGLIGWLVEMMAWVAGWILEKLGFDKDLTDSLKNLDFFKWVMETFGYFSDFITIIVDTVKDFVKEYITDPLTNFLTETPFGKALMDVITPFFDFFGDMMDAVSSIFGKITDLLKLGIKKTIEALPKVVQMGLPQALMNWVGLKSGAEIEEEAARAEDAKMREKLVGKTGDELNLERLGIVMKTADVLTAMGASQYSMAKRQKIALIEKMNAADAAKANVAVGGPTTNNNTTNNNTEVSATTGGAMLKTMATITKRSNYGVGAPAM